MSTIGHWTRRPMVEDLALAVRSGNWPEAHALQDLLSVDVTVAA